MLLLSYHKYDLCQENRIKKQAATNEAHAKGQTENELKTFVARPVAAEYTLPEVMEVVQVKHPQTISLSQIYYSIYDVDSDAVQVMPGSEAAQG